MLNIFNIFMKLRGFDLALAKRDFARIQTYEGEAFEQYITRARDACLLHHLKTSPAIGRLYGSDDPDSLTWQELPIIDKKFFQEASNTAFSRSYKNTQCFSNSTSGSSGIPFRFYKDKYSHAMTWAHIIETYKTYGIDYGRSLQARFFGMPIDSSKAVRREKLKDWISRRHRFSAHDMSAEKCEYIVDVFRRYKFTYAYGYTNTLALFSRYLISEGLCVKKICPSLSSVVFTSEVCTSADRKIIEDAFGVRVYSEYGAAELGVLAFENEEGRHVANNRQFYFEVVDEQGYVVPDGKVGRLLVTSLFNKAMPFIRYELGDRASLVRDADTLYIEKLEGRTGEHISLPNGNKVPALTLYTSTKMIATRYPQIKEFYVRQTELNVISFELVMSGSMSANMEKDFRETTNKYLTKDMEVLIRQVDVIQRTSAGKMRHFESCISDS